MSHPPKPTGLRVEPGTDADLMRRCIAGDERAWHDLVDRYKRLVYSIPRRYGLGQDASDEVFQNVFITTLRHLPKLRSAKGFPKWLMVVAHRECWRTARGLRLPALPPGLAPTREDAPPEEALLRWERQHMLDQGLRRLGGRCEDLLRAVFLDPSRPSYSAVAERLGMPVGSIGPVRARCLAKLLELMEDVE